MEGRHRKKLNGYTHNFSDHKPKPRITTFNEAPEFLRVPFILSGYRIDHHLWDCIKSLMQIHNETVNIWTHFMGSLILLGLFCQIIFMSEMGTMNVALISLFLLSCAYGLSASAIFHCFNCVDAEYHRKLRTLDFGGIAAVILGSGWPVAYFTFYCHYKTLYFYLVMFSVVSPLLLCMPFVSFFHKHNHLRTCLYSLSAGFPAYGYLHFIIMDGTSSEFIPILFVPVGISYLFFGTGMILYVTRIPERFWPGAFDLYGTSHQIWHVLVVVGQWILYGGIFAAARYRYTIPCPQ